MQLQRMPVTPEFNALLDAVGAPAVGLGRRAGDCCSAVRRVPGPLVAVAAGSRPGRSVPNFAGCGSASLLGVAAAVFVGLSMWLDIALIDGVAIVFCAALLLIGLAAAHRTVPAADCTSPGSG